MKSHKFTIATLLLVTTAFFDTQQVYAISGVCSSHLGVNCAVYNSTNSDAICNDGTDSSVNYHLMDECKQQVPVATNIYEFMVQQANIEYQDAQARSDANSRAYIAEKQAELKNTLAGLASSGTTLAAYETSNPTEYQKMLQYAGGNEYALQGLYAQAVKDSQPVPTPASEAEICKSIAGAYSIALSGSSCGCVAGYHMDINNNYQCVQNALTNTTIIPSSNVVSQQTVSIDPLKQKNINTTVKTSDFKKSIVTPLKKSISTTTIDSVIQATSTVPAKTNSLEVKKQKHWYDWLNPLSWF